MPSRTAPMLHELDDAGKQLGVRRSTLYALMSSGELESVKIGTRRLIPHDALLAYVRRLRETKAAS